MTRAAPFVAAVDLGTNSTNLLITDGSTRRFVTTDTRLGEGVDAARRLSAVVMERTLATLGDYARLVDATGVTRVAAVATSAVRDAANREEFLDAVERVLGVRPTVITGEVEGRLAFAGATSGLGADVARPIVLIDIGGGSTEFTVGTVEVDAVVSADVGSVRLTEAELHGDPPRPQELTNAIGAVYDALDDVMRTAPAVADARTAVGIGGTITTVAAVELGTMDRERISGLVLSRDAVEDVFRTLATERLADRLHNPGLSASRAPVIVGGLCVLVAVMRRLHLDVITVSERTLLDGVCQDLLLAGPGSV